MTAGSWWGGRSSRSSLATKRKLHRSSTSSSRPREEVEGNEVKKPDADEVRRRRLAYYTATPLERRKISTAAKPTGKFVYVGASSVRSSSGSNATSERKSRTSRHRSGATKSRKEPEERRNDSDEYVYGSKPAPAPLDSIAEEVSVNPQDNRQEEARKDERHHNSRRDVRPSRTHTSSRRESRNDALEREVTPADSISQAGVSDVSQRRRDPAYTRPSLKRSSTTSTKVERRSEERHAESSKRSSRPESTVLDSTSRRHSTTSVPQAPRLVECLTCGADDVPVAKSAKLACKHRMCHDCLRRVFEMSIKDPAHMPPKCCTADEIPLTLVERLFDEKFKKLWNRKLQEYRTKNRVYCPTPKCGHWIKPSHVKIREGRKVATCPRCYTKVCVLCNNKMHRSSDCPKDPAIVELLEQAEKEGWRRCFKCKSLVERREGCNHMTCRCLAEFCIVCGKKWKTCECPWFDYTALPNPDRLNDMRIPEPIQVMYRQVFRAAADAVPPPAPNRAPPRNGPLPEVTYQQEMDNRRLQERLDADLARRLQLASIIDPEDDRGNARPHRRAGDDETWGLGNAARHFLNDDFVQNAANVVMNAFGDATLGRRGERSSGRRRRPRATDQNANESGLMNNFLGDESVLGTGPPPPVRM